MVARITSRISPFVEQRLEAVEAELFGPDAVERREVAHQHEVAAAVAARLLDRDDVGGRFDDAERRGVAPRRGADFAELAIRQHAAAPAVHDVRRRVLEGARERAAAVAVALEQVESHALGRLRADARQDAQGLDEAGKSR